MNVIVQLAFELGNYNIVFLYFTHYTTGIHWKFLYKHFNYNFFSFLFGIKNNYSDLDFVKEIYSSFTFRIIPAFILFLVTSYYTTKAAGSAILKYIGLRYCLSIDFFLEVKSQTTQEETYCGLCCVTTANLLDGFGSSNQIPVNEEFTTLTVNRRWC